MTINLNQEIFIFIAGSIVTVLIQIVSFKINKSIIYKQQINTSIYEYILKNKYIIRCCIEANNYKKICWYSELRDEVNTNIHMIFTLPMEMRRELIKVHNIINLSGNELESKRENLNNSLRMLYNEFNSYGVEKI